MPPDAGRLRKLLVAGWDLLRLELRVVTGNRLLVLALVEALFFVVVALNALFSAEPWETESYYLLTVLVPGLLPAVALGMACVMGERDTRQLEVTFATAGGRYQVWVFRIAAIALTCVACAGATSLLTTAALDHEHRALAATLHAAVPVLFVVTLTAALSVLFNGAAVAGLLACGACVASFFFLHLPELAPRFDPLLNPFRAPRAIVDPATWFRVLVFNRCLFLALAGGLLAFFLWLLQRRERLL